MQKTLVSVLLLLFVCYEVCGQMTINQCCSKKNFFNVSVAVAVKEYQGLNDFAVMFYQGIQQGTVDSRLNVIRKTLFDVDSAGKVLTDVIEDLSTNKTHGFIVFHPSFESSKATFDKVIANGIPIVNVFTGGFRADEDRFTRAVMSIGMDETDAAAVISQWIAKNRPSVKKMLCVQESLVASSIEKRCQSIGFSLNATVDNYYFEFVTRTVYEDSFFTKFQAGSYDMVLCNDAASCLFVYNTFRKKNHLGKVFLGGVDFQRDMVEGLRTGVVDFIVDQQPYLQGYLAVMLLKLRLSMKAYFPNTLLTTGPLLYDNYTTLPACKFVSDNCVNLMRTKAYNVFNATTNTTMNRVVVTYMVNNPDSAFSWKIDTGARQAVRDLKVPYITPFSTRETYVGNQTNFCSANDTTICISTIIDPAMTPQLKNLSQNQGMIITGYNSGIEEAVKIPSVGHVGMNDYDAGYEGGKQLGNLGVSTVACVLNPSGHSGIQARCQGFKDYFKNNLPNVTVLPNKEVIIYSSQDDSIVLIKKLFVDFPNLDGVLAAFGVAGIHFVSALAQMPPRPNLKVGSLDPSTTLIDAMNNKTLNFLIDQQPLLQGYIPLMLGVLYNVTGMRLVDRNSTTFLFKCGPMVVDTPALIDSKSCENSFGPVAMNLSKTSLLGFECFDDTKPTTAPDDTTERDRVYLAFRILYTVLSGLGLAGCLFFLFVITKMRAKFMAAGIIFMQLILVGAGVGYVGVIFLCWMDLGTSCYIPGFLFGLGFATMFGNIISKNYRIYAIFKGQEENLKNQKSFMVKQSHVLRVSFILILIEVFLLILWVLLGSCGSSIYVTLLLIYKGILVAVGVVLAILTRNVRSTFSETKIIGYCCQNIALVSVFFIPISYLVTDGLILFIVWGGTILFILTFTICALFIPRMVRVEESSSHVPHSTTGGSGGNWNVNGRTI